MDQIDKKLYYLAGEVLKLIQEWEQVLKNVTIKYNIEKSDDKRSLSNMASFLYRGEFVSAKEYVSIKRIIEIRNFVIHKMFLEYNDDTFNHLEFAKNEINQSIIVLYELLHSKTN